MSKVYAIADLHFGHDKVAVARGFASGIEHDAVLADNWRRVVTKRDVVYVLGDVFDWQQLAALPGIKKLAMGNHDTRARPELLASIFTKWHAMFQYDGCLLTHIPVHPSQRHRWRLNVHGHTHTNVVQRWEESAGFVPDTWYRCASADQIGLAPILLNDLVRPHPVLG